MRAGSIPSELGGLVALETLDVRFNQLTGKCDTNLQTVDDFICARAYV